MSNQTSPLNLSSSFGWPKLSSSKVRQSNMDKPTKTEHKNKINAESTNESGLNTINEVSNDNSTVSSRKTSLAITNGNGNDKYNESNWWFWNGKIKDQLQPTYLNIESGTTTQTEVETESSYKKMSSAISHYYNTPAFKSPENTGEMTPLLLNDVQTLGKSSTLPESFGQSLVTKPNNNITPNELQPNIQSDSIFSSWFSWFGFNHDYDDSDESLEGTSDPELFRQAKLVIETSKESSHYAFKSCATDNNIHYFELAVSETKTESQPVKHRSIKKPITPNEAQENILQPSSSPLTSNGSQHILQYPTNNSSSSSIMSGQLNNGFNVPESSISDHCLITPHVDENYRTITLVTRLKLMIEHLQCYKNTSESHIYSSPATKVQNRRRSIKKVVIIGVHGFLPTKMVKTLIAQSTGTSVNFVNEAVKAMQTWLHENETSQSDYDIQTIALEGEGIIEERVDKLYRLLENWIDIIVGCDFLFVATHSLGMPVAIHLLARLLENYTHLKTHKRIGFLSMSGIFIGPLAGLNSKLVIRAYSSTENRILNELFEFQKPNSEQSIKLIESIRALVHRNVKLTFCGSIDDQLVPVFSSIGTNFDHPNIFKCLFVDKHTDVPRFVISLIKIILIMKNLGYSDHNLLRDLSEKCMGTLADGGHGKIFKHETVYLTAIRHTLETTNLIHPKNLRTTPVQNSKPFQNNHFHIPWNIRGLLNDLLKIKNVPSLHLINILIKDFHEWKPTLKKWKDLKYCFDAFEEIELEDLFL